MHLTNPTWVHHDGGAIYSIDAHPSAEKIATCGQGDVGGNGVVIIWNLKPIQSEKAYGEASCHKILAKIKHQAGVNCVRWSVDGAFLACASDDKVISIYEYGGRLNSVGSVECKSSINVEKYRLVHTLHNHCMEVLCVEWSVDGRYMASSSMDNTIVVWNAKKLPERVVVLDITRGGHCGPVKGVSWDPIGKYLASQSADKSLRLWTTDNWQCDTVITKPFQESSQTTMFSRLDWSPDGQFLFAPCAMNNQGPTTQIVMRKEWDTNVDLVGHRRAVTAVRVCPSLLSFVDHTGKTLQVTCIAVGSRDKSLSIWVIPHVKRPVLVIQRLFKHSITDITWRGLDLAVCSQDGSIKYLSFTEKELGKMLNKEQMGCVCESLYKQRPSQFNIQIGNISVPSDDTPNKMNSTFIDTPEGLLAKRKAEYDSSKDVSKSHESDVSLAPAIQIAQQAELLTEQRKQQIEVRTKDGKRRIQPIFLGSTVDTEPLPPSSVETTHGKESVSDSTTICNNEARSGSKSPSPKKRHIDASTDDSTIAESSDDEMDTSEAESTAKEYGIDKSSSGTEKRDEMDRRTMMMMYDFKKPTMRPIESSRIEVSDASTVLDLPEQQLTMSETVQGVLGDTIEVNNEWAHGGIRSSRIAYSRSHVQQWTAYVGPPVAIAVANRFWVIVGCFDRSVRVFASSSGRLQCALQLDSAPVRMGLNGHKMFVLTQTGRFSSWDADKCKAILARQSIADCVDKEANLTSISVTISGMPLLGFSTGNLFTYSVDLQCWQLVDSMTGLLKLIDSISADELPDGQLGKLLKRRRRPGPIASVPIGVRSSIKETMLEGWLLSAETTGSAQDYRGILVTYVQLLVRNRSVIKLKEVLRRCEGPGNICGLSRSALRADIERIICVDPATATLLKKDADGKAEIF